MLSSSRTVPIVLKPPNGSLPCSYHPATESCPEQHESCPHTHTHRISLTSTAIISFHQRLRLPSGLFPSFFCDNVQTEMHADTSLNSKTGIKNEIHRSRTLPIIKCSCNYSQVFSPEMFLSTSTNGQL